MDYTNTGEWEHTTKLPTIAVTAFGSSINGVFHVFGGFAGTRDPMDTIFSWKAATKVWSTVGHMATARKWHGMGEVPISAMLDHCPDLTVASSTSPSSTTTVITSK